MSKRGYNNSNLTIPEHNLSLAAAYIQMNEEGRGILDMVIQKLAEIPWIPERTEANTTLTVLSKEIRH